MKRALWIVTGITLFFAGWITGRGWESNSALTAADRPASTEELQKLAATDFDDGRQEAATDHRAAMDHLNELIVKRGPKDRLQPFAQLLASLTSENWKNVLERFAETKTSAHRIEWEILLMASGELNGVEAVRFVASEYRDKDAKFCLEGWAEVNPNDALNWISYEADPEFALATLGAVIRGVARTQPHYAFELLDKIPSDIRRDYTGTLASNLLSSSSVADVTGWFDESVIRATNTDELGAGHLHHLFDSIIDDHAFENALKTSPDTVLGWLDSHAEHAYAGPGMRRATESFLKLDGARATEWLTANNPNFSLREATNIAKHWTRDGAGPMEAWLKANPETPSRDLLVSSLVASLATESPGRAAEWLNEIESSTIKDSATNTLRDVLKATSDSP